MRTAYKVWSGVAAGVFCLVALGDLSSNSTTDASPNRSASSQTVAASTATPSPTPVPAAPAAPTSVAPTATATATAVPTVTVTEVIDGDTFVADGQKVRVLGIDSCEMGTYGGEQAKATATSVLAGQQVTLRAQPGVDRDRYGRELRYVTLASGGDLGETMVGYDHTGVYQGHNDASADYLRELRVADTNGRACSGPVAPSSSTTGDAGSGSLDGPSPGDQGLPDGALTGGFCRKHWWC